MAQRISKRLVDGLQLTRKEYFVWDNTLRGFGIRVRESGAKTYIFQYRVGPGRGAPTRRLTIGAVGKITPDQARRLAVMASAAVAGGQDPAAEKAEDRRAITFAKLVDAFLAKHVQAKLKARTYESYKHLLYTKVVPEIGTSQAVKVGRVDIARLHLQWKATPHHANNAVRVIRSMYGWAASEGLVPETFNPARGVKPYRTLARERFLTSAEIERLGVALRLAENEGIPWAVNPDKPISKHIPKEELNRRIVIGPHAAGAIKLLIFTGCRLREILHLEWSHVDVERGLLLLSDSKTGRKTVILNAPALRVLADLPRVGKFVIAGDYSAAPRADLKRPWQAVTRASGLDGLRIHDLRHNFASFGAAGGLGLPIIGPLLGHSQPATTARYAHLDSDPLRRASDKIAATIAVALDGTSSTEVVEFQQKTK